MVINYQLLLQITSYLHQILQLLLTKPNFFILAIAILNQPCVTTIMPGSNSVEVHRGSLTVYDFLKL